MKNFPTKEELESIIALIQALQEFILTGNTSSTKWLKSWQVCQKIGVTKATLRNYCKAGLIQPTKVRGNNFFEYDEVIRMMKNRPQKP